MERTRIYLCLAHMSGNEQKYIQEAFDTNWVVPMGPNVNALEADLENYVNSEKLIVNGDGLEGNGRPTAGEGDETDWR
jgi:dTDP-4-amino-4,6-dideoxygalactose transaminase